MGKRILIFILFSTSFIFINNTTEYESLKESTKWFNSLVIKDHKILEEVVLNYDLGVELGRLGEWSKVNLRDRIQEKNIGWRSKQAPGRFVEFAFTAALKQQNNHQSSATEKRIGSNHWQNMAMNSIFRNWMSAEKLKKVSDIEGLKGSPFRLLAIVNRMDNAGDKDDRGSTHTTGEPRSLGEVHLIYGLIDSGYENQHGEAFPSTFVLSYRLPPLRWKDGKLVKKYDLSQSEILEKSSIWSFQMRMWAMLWKKLSNRGRQTSYFKKELMNILSLAIHPSNFLHMRSNTKVNKEEFELREWYMLQASQQLIPRLPRDEPYKCLSGTSLLTDVVKNYWDEEDLDVSTRDFTTFTFDPGNNISTGRNGFSIPRDTDLLPLITDKRFVPDFLEGCGKVESEMPFLMKSAANDVILNERILFTAPFGRVKPSSFVWQLDKSASERQRHAFAIRTCTGCHSKEGSALEGFHIKPRLKNEDSKVSPFMKGGAGNTFTHANETYRYNEIAHRKDWLIKSYLREAVMFDSLKRFELKK